MAEIENKPEIIEDKKMIDGKLKRLKI